jgi:hypothetical protein
MNSAAFRFLGPILAGSVALFFSGCVHTKITKSAPAAGAGPVHFTKVFVLALVPDEFKRRIVENAVRDQITRVAVVPSFEFLPDPTDLKSKPKVLEALKASGADGVVVVRLVSRDAHMDPSTASLHPVDYAVFSDAYWGTAYDVGAYYETASSSFNYSTIFNIETRIFDAKTEKVIWSGETRSTRDMTNDHDFRGLMIEVANVIKGELKSHGLIE